MNATLTDIEARIDEYLGSKQDRLLRVELAALPPETISTLINNLSHGKKKVFRFLPVPVQREVVWEINNLARRSIVASLTVTELIDLIEGMDSDDASDVVSLVPAGKRRTLLAQLPKGDSREITDILRYGPDSAGQIMQTELVRVPESFTVQECVQRIRRLHKEVRGVDLVFVTNARGILSGYVALEQLIVSDPATRIRELARPVSGIPVDMDREDVVHVFKDADLPTLPVIDNDGRLLGRITSDDIVDVLEEEQTEDIYRLGGVGSEESVFDPAVLSARRRVVWLLVNLATAIMAASVVGLFQDTISRIVILAAYMPIVAGLGGNAGTQIITVIVRGIALKEVELRNVGRILAKEIGIGTMNGILLGALIGGISYLYNGNPMLGVVVGLSMLCNLLVAGLAGTLVPIALKALRLDPALSSSVFTTACTDTGGFFVFLGLATLLLT